MIISSVVAYAACTKGVADPTIWILFILLFPSVVIFVLYVSKESSNINAKMRRSGRGAPASGCPTA
jgi:hypothetical protein